MAGPGSLFLMEGILRQAKRGMGGWPAAKKAIEIRQAISLTIARGVAGQLRGRKRVWDICVAAATGGEVTDDLEATQAAEWEEGGGAVDDSEDEDSATPSGSGAQEVAGRPLRGVAVTHAPYVGRGNSAESGAEEPGRVGWGQPSDSGMSAQPSIAHAVVVDGPGVAHKMDVG